jgi:hypothetical protein
MDIPASVEISRMHISPGAEKRGIVFFESKND